MTDDTIMQLLDALLKRGGGDFKKESAEEILQRLVAYGLTIDETDARSSGLTQNA